MGSDFHSALTGAASQEFGNVQGTLEATRQMLSGMNSQFSAMQAAFSTIIEKAEQSTSDQMKTGREQTEALTALMNGLMVRMQESADQNLGNRARSIDVGRERSGGESRFLVREFYANNFWRPKHRGTPVCHDFVYTLPQRE
jgi:hypothetical protein